MKANKKYNPNQELLSLEEIEQALKSQSKYIEFFNKYDEGSVEAFVQCYAAIKYLALQNKNVYREAYESFHSECMGWAESVLKMVLQKKLFNLQCLWRAEEITLTPFVEISRDFEFWSKNILSCPFIEPIDSRDFEIALSFLKYEKFDMPNWYDRWQDYTSFKSYHLNIKNSIYHQISDNFQKIPAFYSYYDIQNGTQHLLDLPDTRGQKERKYENAYYNKYKVEYENIISNTTCITSQKPILTFDEHDITAFVESVEDVATKEAFFYKNAMPSNDENFELERNLELLKKIKEPVVIRSSSDWRTGVAEAVRAYKQRKALEYLPYIYDLYTVQFGNEDTQNIIFKRMKDFRYNAEKPDYHFFLHWRSRILEGRTILGEAENFNF